MIACLRKLLCSKPLELIIGLALLLHEHFVLLVEHVETLLQLIARRACAPSTEETAMRGSQRLLPHRLLERLREFDAHAVLRRPRRQQGTLGNLRTLALRHHPDKNPRDAAAADRFRRIAEAHAVLTDAARRAEYDRGLEALDSG